jgi:GNAT superfamily N-acetyltransferase
MTAASGAVSSAQEDRRPPQQLGAANHVSFFTAQAEHAEPRFGGVLAWTTGGGATVGFADEVVADPAAARSFADEAIERVRAAGAETVGWWSLNPEAVGVLGPILVARGFGWGWRPNWMVLDVDDLVRDLSQPGGLEIREEGLALKGFVDGVEVGKVTGHVCEVAGQAVGGLYDMAVDEGHRRQGIGSALIVAVAERLAAAGCRQVFLNATGMGQPVYLRTGFRLLGESGQTWWMMQEPLRSAHPDRAEIAFTEALAAGDLEAVRASLAAHPRDLNAELAGRSTPMHLAVSTGNPEAVRLLREHGALLDVVAAWDLGWRDVAAETLRAVPEQVNRQHGSWAMTPLHTAAQRGDIDLARLVLSARPDLTLTDSAFGGTPLGWARHSGHDDIAALIEAAAEAGPEGGPA